jgi:hypothetical protein
LIVALASLATGRGSDQCQLDAPSAATDNSGRWSIIRVSKRRREYLHGRRGRGSADYAITLSTPITIDRLTLNSPSATVQQTGGASPGQRARPQRRSFLLSADGYDTKLDGGGNFRLRRRQWGTQLLQPAANAR